MEAILEAFLRNAAAAPDRTAFVHGERRLSFGELAKRSRRVAAGLVRAGVAPGMPVGILATQGLNFPLALLGLWRAGAIVVPFDPGAPAEDQAARESIVDLEFMVGDADLSLARATTQVLSIADLDIEAEATLPLPPPPENDCLYMFTSGTTGRPKALIHTHVSVAAMVERNVNVDRNVIAGDVVLATIPLQLAKGLLNLVFSPLAAGATVVLVQPFSARIALRTALAWKTDNIVTVPAILKLLATLPEDLGRPALRRVNAGSARLEEGVAAAFEARFGIQPVRTYGMSEVGRIASTGERQEPSFRPIVGWPLIELRLLDDAGVEVSAGEAGEIALRTDSLCRPYCLIEGGVREPLPMAGEFFLTGDIGRLEVDGALALVGRKKAFINGPRLRVDPGEVEAALIAMPGIRDVAVIGMPASHGYDNIHAFVVAESHVSQASVHEHCVQHLSAGKRPQMVDFIAAIPRNGSGKVETWRLRDNASDARKKFKA